jgi:hypothetical protein
MSTTTLVPIPRLISDEEYAQAVADSINAEYGFAVGAVETAIEHARRCGEMLIEVKRAVGHGRWLPWLDRYCRFSERKAQYLMTLAANWGELQAKSADVADLTLTQALAKLTADRAEEPKAGRDDTMPLFTEEQAPTPALPAPTPFPMVKFQPSYRCPACGHRWVGDPEPASREAA